VIVSPRDARAVKQTLSLSLGDDCVVYAAHDVTLCEAARGAVIANTRHFVYGRWQRGSTATRCPVALRPATDHGTVARGTDRPPRRHIAVRRQPACA